MLNKWIFFLAAFFLLAFHVKAGNNDTLSSGYFSDRYLAWIFQSPKESYRLLISEIGRSKKNPLVSSKAYVGLFLSIKSRDARMFLGPLIREFNEQIPDSFDEKPAFLNYAKYQFSFKTQSYDSAYMFILQAKKLFEKTHDKEMQIECAIEQLQIELMAADVFNPNWDLQIEKIIEQTLDKNKIQFARIKKLEGDILHFQKKNSEAITRYAEALKAVPPKEYLLLSLLYNDLATASFPLNNKVIYKNYLEQSVQYGFLAEDSLDAAPAIINLAQYYFSTGNQQKAMELAHLAEKIVDENTDLFLRRDVYVKLFYFHQQLGGYKDALDYSEAARTYSDSISELRDQEYISKLNAQYHFEQINKENRWLSEESKLKSKERNLFMAISIILLVAVSMVIYIFYQRNRNLEALQAEKEKLYQQNVKEILKAQEIKSMNALIEGQQQERKRIAEELHDRLCGMLATIKLQVSSLESKLSDVEVKKIQQIQQYEHTIQLIDNAYDEVRKISHNLSSGTLTNFGLLAALKDLRESLEEGTSFTVVIRSFGLESSRLDTLAEIHIFRVIQELITNVIKHSSANTIQIDLNLFENNLNIIFNDNGTGFDPGLKSRGLGLKNVRSRIERLNGELSIDSNLGNGSTFIINIPIV